MGGGNQYLETGGFSEYLYESVGERKEVNGVKGRMIRLKNGDKDHAKLPSYSNTCDVYFKPDGNNVACQAKAYEGRRMIIDFDWSHKHTNSSDGRVFPKGTIHVQKYKFVGVDKKGKHIFVRLSNEARLMNNYEMKKYGPLIKRFNPKVKFR